MRTTAPLGRLLITGAAAAALLMLTISPASATAGTPQPPTVPATMAVTGSPVGEGARAANVPPAPPGHRAAQRAAAPADMCARTNVQNLGWQEWSCAGAGDVVTVGAPGQGLQVEALSLSVTGTNFCAIAHIQSIGWDEDWSCAADSDFLTVGTTGQGLRLEAVGYGVQTGTICGNAYVQDVGWQGWFCGVDGDFNFAGTTGQNRRIEGLAFFVE